MKRNIGKALFLVTSLLIILLLIFLLAPYAPALFKSKSHFIRHSLNNKVFYESGAEEFANIIAAYLPDAMTRVERIHRLPFKKSFFVYVCNSQRSLNEYIAHDPKIRIRGTVVFGNVFVSPSAFDWNGEDTHRGTILHELSHLHLQQHLGFINNRVKIPIWFHEGLANFVCDCAGESISDQEAIKAIKNGYHFLPNDCGNLFKLKGPSYYGIDYPMFHKQTKLFVTYMNHYNNLAFNDFLLAIQSGKSFSESFKKYYKTDINEFWNQFINHL